MRKRLIGIVGVSMVVAGLSSAGPQPAESNDSLQAVIERLKPAMLDNLRTWSFFHMAGASKISDWGWRKTTDEKGVFGAFATIHFDYPTTTVDVAGSTQLADLESAYLIAAAARAPCFRAVLEEVFGAPAVDDRLDAIYDLQNPLGAFPPILPKLVDAGSIASNLDTDLRVAATQVENEYRWALFFRVASESPKGRRLKWERVEQQMQNLDGLVLRARLEAAVALRSDIPDEYKERYLLSIRTSLEHYITKERRKLMRDVLEKVFEVADVTSFKPLLDEIWGPNDRLETPGENLRKMLSEPGSE